MKAYTDLEQSKKLAEILPIESADMAWYPSYAKDGYSIRMLNDTYPLDIIGEEHDEIPAWSLAALLNISPKETRLLKSATDDTYHCDCPKGNIGKWFDDPIDACYEMICKLKESEDERIRKELIEQIAFILPSQDELNSELDTLPCYNERIERYRSWLEKQGEKKPNGWHSEDEQNLNAVLAFIEDEYLRRWLKDIIHTKYEQCVDDNMKEQKVEPKFKVGDCVISNDGTHTYLVKERKRGAYVMLDIGDNEEFSIIIETADRTGRFWAIQDAKDGDVLVNGSNIFIFHLNGTRLMGYCHVNTNDGRFYDDIGKIECFCTNDAIVTPATKEQRELLFAKMRDSGYEWDSEKKELKRIEPKKLNADEVIEWLNHRELRYDDVVTTVIPDDSPTSVCHKVKWLSDEFINRFKKDFEL